MKKISTLRVLKRLTPILFAAIFLFLSTGEATTLLEMSMEEITNLADIIVVGTAQESSYQWDTERGRIFTYTSFVVDEVIKGDAKTGEVIVKTPGGEIGETLMEVPGAPKLIANGTYILFLYSDIEKYMSNVVGWQGKFTVENGVIQENGKSVEKFMSEIKTISKEIER